MRVHNKVRANTMLTESHVFLPYNVANHPFLTMATTELVSQLRDPDMPKSSNNASVQFTIPLQIQSSVMFRTSQVCKT